MMPKYKLFFLIAAVLFQNSACSLSEEQSVRPLAMLLLGIQSRDQQLRDLHQDYNLTALPEAPHSPAEVIRPGEALFYEKEVSGNRNISCETCHYPSIVSGIGLSLPIEVSRTGFGSNRIPGPDTPHVAENYGSAPCAS